MHAGISMGVPLVVLLLTGHRDLLSFAAFGGFTSLYGRNAPYAVKAPMLAAVGIFMSLSTLVGTLTAAYTGHVLVVIAVVAAVAGLARLLSDATRTGGPAGIFPVFAVSVCAELPIGPEAVVPATLTTAAVAGWAWLVCMSGWVIRHHGPERVAVARALEAVADRVGAIGADGELSARHRAGMALRAAWTSIGSSGRTSRWSARLEALCAHAEEVTFRARLASHRIAESGRSDSTGGSDSDASWAVTASELRRLARGLRRFGEIPDVTLGRGEQAELDGRDAADALARPSGPPLLRQPLERWGTSITSLRPSAPFVPQAIRSLVAVALAVSIAHLLGLGHASWAAVSAVAVQQSVSWYATVDRSIQRALGTGAGLLVGVLALAYSPGAGLTVALVIVLQVGAELMVGLNYALCLMFATPIALLLAHLGHASSDTTLLVDRVLDTFIGIVVGIGSAFAIRNRRLEGVLRSAMDDCRAALDAARGVADSSPADPADATGQDAAARLTEARRLSASMFVMHEAYDAAAGEPWSTRLPADEAADLEREGHQLLARITARRVDPSG